LCASVFDWAQFRRTKGAVKLHLMLDHDGLLPCYGVITDGKQHEVTVTRQWSFPPGAILVFDRGYNDYAWFERLTAEGVFFVTRMKDNADYFVVEDRTMLLVKIPHMQSTFGWHLSNFMVLLRQQLFVYRDLWKWINDPFQAPETPPPQMELAFA
jgi:hypothetical protein